MKTFKQFQIDKAAFLEDAQGGAKDLTPTKDDDKESTEMKPRSKGEEKFVKSHTDKAEFVKHPVAKDSQFDSKDTKQDDHKADGAKDEGGEKTTVEPGTAKVKDDDKDGSKKRDTSKASGKDNGEKKEVDQGSSDADKETKIRKEALSPQMQVYMNDITEREA